MAEDKSKIKKFKKIAETEKSEKTDKLLTKLRKASEEEMAEQLAIQHGLPYMDLNLVPIDNEDVKTIPKENAISLGIACIKKTSKSISVAILDPGKLEALEYLKNIESENSWTISLFVVSRSSIERAWGKLTEKPLLESLDMYHLSLSGKDLENFEKEFGDLLNLKKRIREIPTTQIINIVMAGSVKMKASDIHLETEEKEVRLRYRIDGVLQDIGYIPHEVYKFLLSRIKLLGKMKINVRDIAQDGAFTINIDNGRVDIRVNIIPGKNGESVVMRLLNQASVMLSVEDLGLRGLAGEQLQKEIEKPSGVILTTGPTGSGKTTTLYAIINKLNQSDVKIITIEDPVEYQIKGISQTQINKSRGYTFENGLRAIVRQDPDVILVGEIRDEETADIAINAALTGHLVLSTIHTNSASATIPRLIELGVKPDLIAPATNCFIAQRLVRKLCDNCKEAYVPAKNTIESVKKILALVSPKAKIEVPKDIEQLYRPKGCPQCHNIGYKGRIGLFEILATNETIKQLILDRADEFTITRAAMEEGMITMTQDGIIKAVLGETSMEEVSRVTGQTQFLEETYEKLMEQSLSRAIDVQTSEMEQADQNLESFEKINAFIQSVPQKEIAKFVFAFALLLRAGDIHIEPAEKVVKIRFRIDGILQTIATIPITDYPAFLGDIKVLSGFKSDVRGGVKDSRFSIALEAPYKNITEPKVDVRVSIILGGLGETVVLRLLNKSAVAMEADKIGIRKETLDRIMRLIKKPNGVFLNTGPTGSGKTTTLYSLLGALNKPEVKIITVEDPIEYQLEGVLQTQTNDKDGYSFATALRALLRQNPDIMLIGEIRDEETAKIAVQAAETGHLVLSTLHTNDAASSIQRLLNMGVKPDDLAEASNGFMAQRLVRKLCDCKKKTPVSSEQKQVIEKVLQKISPRSGVAIPPIEFIYQPAGCEKCNGVGYKGRLTVSEVLEVDRDIQEMISRQELSSHIKDKAIENGMLTMQQDGFLKVLEGETTLEEVERVTEE